MSETPAVEPYPNLSAEQRARADALRAARTVLAAKAMLSSSAVDPVDLISVARYVMTGEDPWAPHRRLVEEPADA